MYEFTINPMWILMGAIWLGLRFDKKKQRDSIALLSFFLALGITMVCDRVWMRNIKVIQAGLYEVCAVVWVLAFFSYYIEQLFYKIFRKIKKNRKEKKVIEKEIRLHKIVGRIKKYCRILGKECMICMWVIGYMLLLWLIVMAAQKPMLSAYWVQLWRFPFDISFF